MDTSRVNRVEVIDHSMPADDGGARVLVIRKEGISVSVSLQDDGRTLKVFVSPAPSSPADSVS